MSGGGSTTRRGGRQKGTKNKTNARQEKLKKAAEKAAAVLGEGVFEGDAHDLLVLTYKDTSLPLDPRIDAAKAAIPYEKPRLQSTVLDVKGNIILVKESFSGGRDGAAAKQLATTGLPAKPLAVP